MKHVRPSVGGKTARSLHCTCFAVLGCIARVRAQSDAFGRVEGKVQSIAQYDDHVSEREHEPQWMQESDTCATDGDCWKDFFCGKSTCTPCGACLSARYVNSTSCRTPRCALAMCRAMYMKHPDTQLGLSWGSLSTADQHLWGHLNCDSFANNLRFDRCVARMAGGACFTGTGCRVRDTPRNETKFLHSSAAIMRVPRHVRRYYQRYCRQKLAPYLQRLHALHSSAAQLQQATCEHHCGPSSGLRNTQHAIIELVPDQSAERGIAVHARHPTCSGHQRGWGFRPGSLRGMVTMLEHATTTFGPEMRQALSGRAIYLYFSFYDRPQFAAGKTHLLLPHLAFSSRPGMLDIAVPDWTFFHYPEALSGKFSKKTRSADSSFSAVTAPLRHIGKDWSQKANSIFWRGGNNGNTRERVVNFLARSGSSARVLRNVSFGGGVPWIAQCQHKILLHMAGYGASSGLKYKFVCNSTVLTLNEPEIGEEFYYHALVPDVTHATVAKRADGKVHPADVLAAAERLMADDGAAHAIAKAGAKFAADYLSPTAIDFFWLAFVRRYAELSRELDRVCGSSGSEQWCRT